MYLYEVIVSKIEGDIPLGCVGKPLSALGFLLQACFPTCVMRGEEGKEGLNPALLAN